MRRLIVLSLPLQLVFPENDLAYLNDGCPVSGFFNNNLRHSTRVVIDGVAVVAVAVVAAVAAVDAAAAAAADVIKDWNNLCSPVVAIIKNLFFIVIVAKG